MTQKIDPVKLKAAAEHLEWVCQQYPDNEDVQGLYRGLQTMIEDAKEGRVIEPVADRQDVPYGYSFADGKFQGYDNPSVDSAYYGFSREMRGGLSDAAKRTIAKLAAMDAEIKAGGLA